MANSGTTDNSRIKVPGYAQKIFYTDGIEYRPFSPDITTPVGPNSKENTQLFTMGSFNITTNMEPKTDKTFISNKFSNFISLSDLDLTVERTQTLLEDNAGVILNLDRTNLKYYALFGSLSEFVRVSLENIITKWPASLFLYPIGQTATGQLFNGNTFDSYTYDFISDTASFRVDTNFIQNKFEINYLTNGTIVDSFNETNDTRNMAVNFNSYAILYNELEYPVLEFTGATFNTNDYIYFKVKGDVFSGMTQGKVNYHIKPNKDIENSFFNELPEFEAYLLSRNITPQYTAVFKYPIKSDSGIILYITNSVTWPTTDGYNIDFDTTGYVEYANKLLDIASNNDLYSSDLINRFLVTESITDFDTTSVHLSDGYQDATEQKMNKVLRIYGRSFDEFNNYISGIAFANTVSYDKQDNTPDVYLKNLAKVLGWELITSELENDLIGNYITPSPSQYSGQTVGLTPAEADIELWRRIILNTPWIWKSKGARKSVEFLLRFIGVPEGLVEFNEHVYKAEGPIDVELFKKVLELNNLDNTDLSIYPIDDDGYPNPLPNTPEMYFQNDGLWYRETGGSGATIDIYAGNNPHVGPYDGGFKYINQFNELIPNFSAVTITSETITKDYVSLFTNDDLGTFNNSIPYSTIETTNIKSLTNGDLSGVYVYIPTVIPDPLPTKLVNRCGITIPGNDNISSLCLEHKELIKTPNVCNDSMVNYVDNTVTGLYEFSYNQYNTDGSIYTLNGSPVLLTTNYAPSECCKSVGGSPVLYDKIEAGIVVNSGYYCCDGTNRCGCEIAKDWVLSQSNININGNPYYVFIKPDGSNVVVTPDGCNCDLDKTSPIPNIIDPFTGVLGVGCQVKPVVIPPPPCASTIGWTISDVHYLHQNVYYVLFANQGGSPVLTTPDGCQCGPTSQVGGVPTNTIVDVLDPFTGLNGKACKVGDYVAPPVVIPPDPLPPVINQTTEYCYKAIHPEEHSQVDSVTYYNINDVKVTEILQRFYYDENNVFHEAPCTCVDAIRVPTTIGAIPCTEVVEEYNINYTRHGGAEGACGEIFNAIAYPGGGNRFFSDQSLVTPIDTGGQWVKFGGSGSSTNVSKFSDGYPVSSYDCETGF